MAKRKVTTVVEEVLPTIEECIKDLGEGMIRIRKQGYKFLHLVSQHKYSEVVCEEKEKVKYKVIKA